MNGYKAFYRRKTMDVYAETSYKAQVAAALAFKARKVYEVTVVLCEVDGKQVIHTPSF